jgi:hypothetical protein
MVLACLAALVAGQQAGTASTPIALHPDNPHYFLWRGKPTVLITSGEHYGALMNLDFDYRKYFDTLAADVAIEDHRQLQFGRGHFLQQPGHRLPDGSEPGNSDASRAPNAAGGARGRHRCHCRASETALCSVERRVVKSHLSSLSTATCPHSMAGGHKKTRRR